MPAKAITASVIVSQYADHMPLYRQHQIYARQGVDIFIAPPWPSGAARPRQGTSGRSPAMIKRELDQNHLA
jgi:hypothetical protein